MVHDSGNRSLPQSGKTPAGPPAIGRHGGIRGLARVVLWGGSTMLPRHRRRLALSLLLHACVRSHEPPTDASPDDVAVAEATSELAEMTLALPLRPEVRVLRPRSTTGVPAPATDTGTATTRGAVVRFVEQADVHLEPDVDAPLLGVVGYGERVRLLEQVGGKGCDRPWARLEPHGFVCAKHETVDGAPSQVVLPRLPRGGLVPGVYGKLRDGQAQLFPTLDAAARGEGGTVPLASLTVRRQGTDSIGGRRFWRTRHGYVAASDLRALKGSRFRGVTIGAEGLERPIAWARFRGDDGAIAVRATATGRGKVVSRMRAREHARVEATSPDGKFVQLAGLGWVARDEVRIAAPTEPPPGLLTPDERWIDIDVDEQVLVAYEGSTPIYATLVSTGRRTHDTPIGTFRIERKVAERTMSSKPGDDEPYSVDRVPWTAYFTGSFALHAAYWHGSFGERKSHGCVNLAPADAKQLYRWSAPALVPAWSEVHGHVDQPGSIVRVRDGKHPSPPLYGYAAELAAGLPTEIASATGTPVVTAG